MLLKYVKIKYKNIIWLIWGGRCAGDLITITFCFSSKCYNKTLKLVNILS